MSTRSAGTRAQELRYGENPTRRRRSTALAPPGKGRRGDAGSSRASSSPTTTSSTSTPPGTSSRTCRCRRPRSSSTPTRAAPPPRASLADAYQRAYECDTTSAFGGIVALNQECDAETARRISTIFVEVVAAPAFSDAALEVFNGQKATARATTIEPAAPPLVKVVSGGFLVQSPDSTVEAGARYAQRRRREPTEAEWEQLLLAWRVVKHVKSNAIVLVRDDAAVGVGAGQMSRVESVQLAVQRAG